MSEGTESPTKKGERPLEKTTILAMFAIYASMLVASLLILLIGINQGNFLKVFIAAPVILILVSAVLANRRTIHMPPFMIFIVIGLMAIVIAGKFLFDYNTPSMMVTDWLFGVLLGICGLILAYSFVPMLFDPRESKPVNALFVSVSIGLAIYVIWVMIQYYTGTYLEIPESRLRGFEVLTNTEVMMDQLVCVIIGIMLISVGFYLGRNSAAIKRLMAKHLLFNSAAWSEEEFVHTEIEKALAHGESETVEYKSTLKTDLSTGEREDRIERSVLKTLVAFLNSDGGTLLVGVSDKGEIIGIDKSFENYDKASLHLTNMISTHIGNEFLPYISFNVSDFEGKGVMRVVCKKSKEPVFLKEWPNEYFFVRSGTASMEINGKEMVYYIDHHFKKRMRK